MILSLTSAYSAADESPCCDDPVDVCGEGCPCGETEIDFCPSSPDSLFSMPESDVLKAEVVYTADIFGNGTGGVSGGNSPRFKGLLDIVITADLDKAGLTPVGGRFVVHGLESHGAFLNQDIDVVQDVTNIDSRPFTAIGEYFWEKDLADDAVLIRIGRQTSARMFSVMDLASDFVNPGFIKSPNNRLPWYPAPTIGATSAVSLTDQLQIRGGTFVDGRAGSSTPWGWSENGRVYSILQTNYSWMLGDLPGDLQVGGWHLSGSTADVGGGASHTGNHGFYFGIEQLLIAEDCHPDQGIGAFAIYSVTPYDRNLVTNHYAGGLVYRGLFHGRDDDTLGMGLSACDFSRDSAVNQDEITTELFYKANITSRLMLEPDLQWIQNPSGVNPDALFAGVRVGFEL